MTKAELIDELKTLRKHVSKLQNEKDRAEEFFRIAGVMFVVIDTHGIVTKVNEKTCEVLGYPGEEIVGKNWFDHFVPPLMKNEVKAISGRLLEGKTKDVERHENPVLTKSGEVRLIAWFNAAERNSDGEIIGHISSGEDITERKEAEDERKRLEEQLYHAQKIEAIGTLAGGIAHDFNNILGAIMGYTELSLLDLPQGSEVWNNQEQILFAAQRAREMVIQILAFSRKYEQELKPIYISRIVDDTLKLMRSSLPKTIDIQVDVHENLRPVLADQTRIYQALMNLCANAAHAMKENGGVLKVTLKEETSNGYQLLSVSDTGHGMDEQIKKRIFDPYFTTKKQGEGTGMGLSVIHGIVKKHKGEITVESEPGKGATFNIYLPIAENESEATGEMEMPICGGSEKILFVDDEIGLGKMGKQMLEKIGYSIETSVCGTDAVELFRSDPYRFDLIITDQSMPGMTGVQLAREIKGIRPDIPVILCTGFSESINEKNYKSLGVNAFVMKPILMSQISQTVRQVLDITKNEAEGEK